MAKIHDKFIIELAEVIKGYGNDPDVEDPFNLSMFYRFYELPNIAISRENFEKMTPYIEERKTGKWEHGRETSREYQGKMLSKIWYEDWHCGVCGIVIERSEKPIYKFCPSCGADMREQP